MPDIDLHQIVPDPPDDLLDFGALDAAIHRRSVQRSRGVIAAIAAIVLALTGGVIGVAQRGSSKPVVTTTSRVINGDIITAATGKPALHPAPCPSCHAASRRDGLALSNLVAVDSDGNVRPITSGPGAVIEAVVTSDDQHIAYVRETDKPFANDNGFTAHLAIWLVDIDGSDQHELYKCAHGCNDLAWSPDGSQLAFAANGIWTLDLSGHARLLCNDKRCGYNLAQPTWSPDGRQIAFSQEGFIDETGVFIDPSSAIWIINSDGSDPRRLTDRRSSPSRWTTDVAPSWSPDGQSIAFARWGTHVNSNALRAGNQRGPAGIYTVTVADEEVRPLTQCAQRSTCETTRVAWSPDGSKIAFTGDSAPSGISVVNVSGTPLSVKLPTFYRHGKPVANHVDGFAWSPDSTKLVMIDSVSRNTTFTFAGRVGVPSAKLAPAAVIKVNSQDNGPLLWLPKPAG